MLAHRRREDCLEWKKRRCLGVREEGQREKQALGTKGLAMYAHIPTCEGIEDCVSARVPCFCTRHTHAYVEGHGLEDLLARGADDDVIALAIDGGGRVRSSNGITSPSSPSPCSRRQRGDRWSPR